MPLMKISKIFIQQEVIINRKKKLKFQKKLNRTIIKIKNLYYKMEIKHKV